jgi:hypothetical protein
VPVRTQPSGTSPLSAVDDPEGRQVVGRGRRHRLLAAGAVLLVLAAVLLVGLFRGGEEPAATPGDPLPRWSCQSGSAAPSGSRPGVGVQFHGAWSDYTDGERTRVLDVLASTGMSWVRIDATWSALQPVSAGQWDEAALHRLDTSIDLATDRHLKVLVTLLNTPGWAGGGPDGVRLPSSPASYADAIGSLARRYGDRVAAWEVWNEPNSTEFAAGADARAYARLLRAAYPAVKAAVPRTPVVFGGTQYNDAAFVAGAYAAGARGFFDVMATHPYSAPSDAAPSARDDGSIYSLGHLRAVRQAMVENGDAEVPVWVTEIGWSTHANSGGEQGYQRGVSAEQQAGYLRQTLELLRSDFPYVEQVFWYAERDRRKGDAQIANFGLLTTALHPKPAAQALACYLGR